jgi:hypothetical protein
MQRVAEKSVNLGHRDIKSVVRTESKNGESICVVKYLWATAADVTEIFHSMDN